LWCGKSGGQCGCDAVDQRDDGLPEEGAVGFGVVGVGVVAGEAEQLWWDTEGQCDLAGRGVS
jgi:hypothetical protein